MEFNEKLQELRKRRGITQEELANALFVSRTAVSKWESGRGYPNIDSLKAIAKYFSVTIDELLSSDEVLCIAEEDHKRKEQHFRSLIFSVLDLSIAAFLFLPFFGQRANANVQAVSLLALNGIPPYLKFAYWFIITGMIVIGLLTLTLQIFRPTFWSGNKNRISLVFNILGVILFIISAQPYAAVFLFIFLIIKLLMPGKKQ